jgi:hypothetical protein
MTITNINMQDIITPLILLYMFLTFQIKIKNYTECVGKYPPYELKANLQNCKTKEQHK